MEKKRERRDNSQRDNCQKERERDKERERLSEDTLRVPPGRPKICSRIIGLMVGLAGDDRESFEIVFEVEVQ